MTNVTIGLAALILVLFLVIILGLQIQITALTRRIDELVDRI